MKLPREIDIASVLVSWTCKAKSLIKPDQGYSEQTLLFISEVLVEQ